MLILLILLLAVVIYVVAILKVNRLVVPVAGKVAVAKANGTVPAGRELRLMTWNLGFGALGTEADFVPDGGRSFRPGSAAVVARNTGVIASQLGASGADVFTLQEVSRGSPMSHGVNQWQKIIAALPEHDRVYASDVVTRLIPPPLRIEHGAATLARVTISAAETVPLPLEPNYHLGFMRKGYQLLVTRIPIASGHQQWVIANAHLSAFDQGAVIRRKQVDAVLAFVLAEHGKGNYVVIAGDWNMTLVETTFPHRTEERYLDWVYPFPKDILMTDWRIAADGAVPTVRTLHKAYEKGDNYVAVVDGFLVSPNVEVLETVGIDLGFSASDHNPVMLTVRATEKTYHASAALA